MLIEIDINLPVGAIATLCFIWVSIPAYPRKPWTSKTLFWDLDVPGFIILAPASVMLLLSITWGGNEYSWNSATIIGMLCGAAVNFAIFTAWEIRMKDQAMIPASIVRLRPVASSVAVSGLAGGAMLIITYFLPLWFQSVQGIDPTTSGVNLLPLFLSQVVFAVVAGITGV